MRNPPDDRTSAWDDERGASAAQRPARTIRDMFNKARRLTGRPFRADAGWGPADPGAPRDYRPRTAARESGRFRAPGRAPQTLGRMRRQPGGQPGGQPGRDQQDPRDIVGPATAAQLQWTPPDWLEPSYQAPNERDAGSSFDASASRPRGPAPSAGYPPLPRFGGATGAHRARRPEPPQDAWTFPAPPAAPSQRAPSSGQLSSSSPGLGVSWGAPAADDDQPTGSRPPGRGAGAPFSAAPADPSPSSFGPPELPRPPASVAHAHATASSSYTPRYVPGGPGLTEAPPANVAAGSASAREPYFYEAHTQQASASPLAHLARQLTLLIAIVSAVMLAAYAGVCVDAANQLIYAPQVAPVGSPSTYGLSYKPVVFTSRTDHVVLQGWFIPGVKQGGQLTAQRAIIIVHGIRANRADPGAGLLPLSAALAKRGFAVLAFDMRGSGNSTAAPLSLGYFEQRDVLGAVDFLRSGPEPYPNLGRPQAIGGLGISMGASTLLMAAAQEPALRAIVSDSAYADIVPILQREIPARSHLPSGFTPGILEAAQALYGVDFYADRPVTLVARIAPRPILFIHGAADTYVSPENMTELAQAAQQAQNAKVQTWLVPKAKHAQSYHVAGQAYVDRVVSFFEANLTAQG